jgi:ABC-type lipoprotein export system ATPase subunit
MTETVVELRDVFCVHRTQEGDAAALQGTNLSLQAGELLCVLGPSGAGKSTLLRVIAGIEAPSAGVVRVLGSDIGRIAARRRERLRHERIGFLHQHADAALAPDLTVARAVALPLALRGDHARDRRARVAELLALAGLDDRAGALPRELSGGERQRVALCAALAHRPELLLADEPTGELDEESAASIRRLIAELARRHRTSVIVVSHDPATADAADRAVRIRDGRVVEDRRDGASALVVAAGGWVRLPSELLASAGIGDRARARVEDGRVLLSGVPDGTGAPAAPAVTRGGGCVAASEPGRGTERVGRRSSWSPADVRLDAVSRGFGRGAGRREVLQTRTIAFARGRLTAVTGRSGTGKTTLLRLLAGLDRADTGELTIDRVSLGQCDPEERAALRRERIGYLPQEPTPVGFLSAEENVALALALRGWDAREAAERAAVVLTWVGLADRARQRVSRLSAGEAQRVAFARALASARGLLIVDEPTSRLDEANAVAVAELLADAAATDGQTVICATHDPELVSRADEVLAL